MANHQSMANRRPTHDTGKLGLFAPVIDLGAIQCQLLTAMAMRLRNHGNDSKSLTMSRSCAFNIRFKFNWIRLDLIIIGD